MQRRSTLLKSFWIFYPCIKLPAGDTRPLSEARPYLFAQAEVRHGGRTNGTQ